MKCENCNEELPSDKYFCPSCGYYNKNSIKSFKSGEKTERFENSQNLDFSVPKWYRLKEKRMIKGLFSGVANKYGFNLHILRIIFFLPFIISLIIEFSKPITTANTSVFSLMPSFYLILTIIYFVIAKDLPIFDTKLTVYGTSINGKEDHENFQEKSIRGAQNYMASEKSGRYVECMNCKSVYDSKKFTACPSCRYRPDSLSKKKSESIPISAKYKESSAENTQNGWVECIHCGQVYDTSSASICPNCGYRPSKSKRRR